MTFVFTNRLERRVVMFANTDASGKSIHSIHLRLDHALSFVVDLRVNHFDRLVHRFLGDRVYVDHVAQMERECAKQSVLYHPVALRRGERHRFVAVRFSAEEGVIERR